ncbi:TonB family protein [Inmirania thermothiophila]|uniref:TonB family protein n=1 Tax=Inmirania thermothiophila TaxID=1750597 RepID=A0A3N1YC85_9GAMM|nr:TonB family protein [Inmirania thermothiophila]
MELEVRLDPAGRLATVRIARTSGHGILDREALRALAALRGRRVAAAGGTLRLPVIFRLVTG